jgi:carboxymethylenebutenolidase
MAHTGRLIDFASNGSTTPGYLAEAAGGPGVVVIQEWWGLVDHIKDVADRFAAAGFTALAPDLYHGKVTTSPDEAGRLLMALDIDRAERDLRGAIAHLRKQTGRPVGTVGYCMGGALSLFAACRNGADVGACVVYYGGHPKVRYDLDSLTAPVLAHWAEDDPSVNPHVPALEKALREKGKRLDSHQHPGTKHGFFNDTRPPVYNAEEARKSWEETLVFYRAELGAKR